MPLYQSTSWWKTRMRLTALTMKHSTTSVSGLSNSPPQHTGTLTTWYQACNVSPLLKNDIKSEIFPLNKIFIEQTNAIQKIDWRSRRSQAFLISCDFDLISCIIFFNSNFLHNRLSFKEGPFLFQPQCRESQHACGSQVSSTLI